MIWNLQNTWLIIQWIFPNNYQLSVSEFKGDSETQRTFKINGYKSRTLFDAGVVYEKSGDTVKALSFIEEAYSYGDYNDNVKIMYAKLLVELNRNIDKALTITADLITESKVTNEITELNKEGLCAI